MNSDNEENSSENSIANLPIFYNIEENLEESHANATLIDCIELLCNVVSNNQTLNERIKDLEMAHEKILSVLDEAREQEIKEKNTSSIILEPQINIQQVDEVDEISSEFLTDNDENDLVAIGTNGTAIKHSDYTSIDWTTHKSATRKLLRLLFDRETLALSTLSGRPCPWGVLRDKKTKPPLDPYIVADIIECVTRNCNVSEACVKLAITSTCSDEHNLYKKRIRKKPKKTSTVRTSRKTRLRKSSKKATNKLDPSIVADIIECVTRMCNVSEDCVKLAITSTCSDEHNLHKKRIRKKLKKTSTVRSSRKTRFRKSSKKARNKRKPNISNLS